MAVVFGHIPDEACPQRFDFIAAFRESFTMAFEILPFDIVNTPISYVFLTETFQISFGQDRTLWPNDLGSYSFEKYHKDISGIVARDQRAIWSVWLDGEIIGQVELSKYKSEEDCGYVSFYYLKDSVRGKGFADKLDDFAMNEFRSRGFTKARLTVSQFNNRAQNFYESRGWKVIGPDPKRPFGITMEKGLS